MGGMSQHNPFEKYLCPGCKKLTPINWESPITIWVDEDEGRHWLLCPTCVAEKEAKLPDIVRADRSFEWETCPICKDRETFWCNWEGPYCQGGCFGHQCDKCGDIPEVGLYANGTYEVETSTGSIDVCSECREYDYPDAKIITYPSPALEEVPERTISLGAWYASFVL